MVFKLIKYSLIFFMVPYLIGVLFADNNHNKKLCGASYVLYYYVVGFITMLAVFEIMCVPMSIMRIHLHVLFNIFSSTILFLCILSIILLMKKKRDIFIICKESQITKNAINYFLLAMIFIGVQLFFVVYYQSNWMSGDDYEYVTRTSASLYTDMIVTNGIDVSNLSIIPKRSFCSWEIYIAWLCKLSGINVPTMVHTVLNVSLVAVAFGVFYLLGCELFDKLEDRLLFLIVISFANLFGLYSHYSLTFRWLMTMWQGKAVFMVIVFQFLFVFVLRISKTDYSIANSIIWIMLSLASCALTPTGVGMYAGAVLVLTILLIVVRKKMWYIKYLLASVLFPAIFMVGYLYFK